jgi:hypothetical protein
MSTIDEVARMQAQGMSEQDIVSNMKSKGASGQEIMNAISQSKIKQAVSNNDGLPPMPEEPPMPSSQMPSFEAPSSSGQPSENYFPGQGSQNGQEEYSAQSLGGNYGDMQPSMMSQPAQNAAEYSSAGQETAGGQYGYQDNSVGDYPAYQPYQDSMSSDMVTEISEQVVNEKMSALHDKLESIMDMRTIVEANMINLNDRLKRMEKIIDQLQVSVLKKIGDYLTDVQDVKKELEETQKSFVAIHKKKKH